MFPRICIFVLILFVLSGGDCTLSPTKRTGAQKNTKNSNSKEKTKLDVRKGPQADSVHDLGLVNIKPTAENILVNNGAWSERGANSKNTTGLVLGYVTPVSVFCLTRSLLCPACLCSSGTAEAMTWPRFGVENLHILVQFGCKF